MRITSMGAMLAGLMMVAEPIGSGNCAAPPNSKRNAPKQSSHTPHQGAREIARRKAKIAAGKLQVSP